MSTNASAIPLALPRALAHALSRHTAQAFGLMGNGNAHFIDELPAAGIAFTAVRHEAATVASADAYGRISAGIAIATTTYGAGFTNTLTALAEAAQARTPLLLVVGDAPTGGARPWDVDQEMMAAAMGVRTVTLSLTDLDATVDRAVASAWRSRRPILLAIPYDLVTTPVIDTEPGGIDLNDPEIIRSLAAATAATGATAAGRPDARAERPRTAASPDELAAAARTLSAAQRPLVLAGRGAWLAGAERELGELADRLGAPTASTALARGIFPDARYDLGVSGGFGQEAAMAVVAEADVVVVVGASLNQFTMRFGELFAPGCTVIRIDADQVAAPRTVQPISQLLLRGDAAEVLRLLLAELPAGGAGWRERLTGLEPGGALRRRDDGLAAHPDGRCPDGRLDPRAVAVRLGALLPEDRRVTSDGGHFIGWANMFWPVAAPERMIMVGTAFQTIGLGFSTVAGVAAAAPESTVVVTTGDGGGLMALADLETTIRTAASCVIVVWNDAVYGAEVHVYGAMGLDESPMRIPEADFAAIARGLGAHGVRVETLEDLDALREWSAAGARGTILLDCRVSPTVVAPYQREIQRVNGIDAGPEEGR